MAFKQTDRERQITALTEQALAAKQMQNSASTLGSTLGDIAAKQRGNGDFFTNLIGGFG